MKVCVNPRPKQRMAKAKMSGGMFLPLRTNQLARMRGRRDKAAVWSTNEAPLLFLDSDFFIHCSVRVACSGKTSPGAETCAKGKS